MQSIVEKDVVVLGTGAGGLTAALSAARAGADVGLYEKSSLLGGSTAISGGVTWVPLNHHQDAAGIADSREDAIDYLESLSLGRMDPALAQTFVDNGRVTVQWLEEVTALRFTLLPNYPDYHPENAGGKPNGGRSLDPGLFSYTSLGPWQEKVSRSKRGAHLKITDTTLGGGAGFLEPDELQRRVDNDLRGCGSALIGPIIKALLDLGVEPVLGATATELIMEDGRVTGVQLVIDGVEQTVYARRGVILATGGFEWNNELVNEFLRGPMTAPTSVPTNTGDGLLMSMRAGARLGNMGQAWWVPAVKIPGDVAFGAERSNLVNRERTLPGSIMVNRYGKRFTNEATNYNALGGAFHQMDPMSFGYTNLPAWLIFDGRNAQQYGSFGTPAGEPIAEWIPRAIHLKHSRSGSVSILMDSRPVWIAGTILLTQNQMQTLVAVTAPTTVGVATGNIGSRRPRHWGGSTKHLSMPYRSSPALWAPVVVREQIPPDAYWIPTHNLFPGFTR